MLFNVNNKIKSCIDNKIVLGSGGCMVRYNIKIYCVKVCKWGLYSQIFHAKMDYNYIGRY